MSTLKSRLERLEREAQAKAPVEAPPMTAPPGCVAVGTFGGLIVPLPSGPDPAAWVEANEGVVEDEPTDDPNTKPPHGGK